MNIDTKKLKFKSIKKDNSDDGDNFDPELSAEQNEIKREAKREKGKNKIIKNDQKRKKQIN